jgi:hypothetical protein
MDFTFTNTQDHSLSKIETFCLNGCSIIKHTRFQKGSLSATLTEDQKHKLESMDSMYFDDVDVDNHGILLLDYVNPVVNYVVEGTTDDDQSKDIIIERFCESDQRGWWLASREYKISGGGITFQFIT